MTVTNGPPDREKQIEAARARLERAISRYMSLEDELRELEASEFRVCIFGSARIRPSHPTYHLVYRTARLLAEMGVDVITGGGPGLMEAANRAVRDAKIQGSHSYGLPIELPRSQELANRHLDIKSEHKRFSSRLDEFMRLSQAVIVAPGGIGTLLELMYVWQLVQVQMLPKRPIVLLGRDMWQGLVSWMESEMLGRGLVSAGDFDTIHLVDSPEEALHYVREELQNFQEQWADRPETVAQAQEMIAEMRRREKSPSEE